MTRKVDHSTETKRRNPAPKGVETRTTADDGQAFHDPERMKHGAEPNEHFKVLVALHQSTYRHKPESGCRLTTRYGCDKPRRAQHWMKDRYMRMLAPASPPHQFGRV